MKLIDPNASFMWFYFLETVYTRFHLDETHLLFINSLSFNKNLYMTTHLLKMKLPLGVA
jgi:hypothetical protein